jgi:hypothetical protein
MMRVVSHKKNRAGSVMGWCCFSVESVKTMH